MPETSAKLRDTLLQLQQRDLAMRDQLAKDGTLYHGYHPRMEQVHRDNARQLREIIEDHGWPNERLVSADGAEAAWLVAQHAIGEPEFMRACRDLLAQAVAAGTVPAWQFAYLDDRIRVFEGRPQHYGTQFDVTPEGPTLELVDDAEQLDERRRTVGLGPIAQQLERMRDIPRPSAEAIAARKREEQAWRVRVGWNRS